MITEIRDVELEWREVTTRAYNILFELAIIAPRINLFGYDTATAQSPMNTTTLFCVDDLRRQNGMDQGVWEPPLYSVL